MTEVVENEETARNCFSRALTLPEMLKISHFICFNADNNSKYLFLLRLKITK